MPPDLTPPQDPVEAVRAMTRQAVNANIGPRDTAPRAPVPPSPPTRGIARFLWLAPAAILAAALGLLFVFHAPHHRQTPLPPAPRSAPTLLVGEPEDEPTLLAEPAPTTIAHPFAPAPDVLVLLYPGLHTQALAMNRIGAFVEKAGVPHDHVLSDAALEAAIAASNDKFDTYYFGHDYRASDLAHFFRQAARDHVTLRPQELALQATLQQRGMLQPGATGAVITLPPLSSDPPVDAAARATILRHELSHGIYFTDPAYADYTIHFWNQVMTSGQRTAFRALLGREGYDTTQEDLMRNEMQAYLVHTRDPRFFNPASLGLPVTDVLALRAAFAAGMPAGWLREHTP